MKSDVNQLFYLLFGKSHSYEERDTFNTILQPRKQKLRGIF